ncbi:putative zinc finger protein [Trypanosoma conorhini]|uniref:Putative zinc finger protein n=1 Tax=Trypanosoma conorhini TaxID=83891 RepID=A0A3R7LDQ0_9TRYP|nr:putative zinc finger protein [Trypanosoma conorhini]RNF26333.1 putative zinc finger protein [Trypanosoma conorhini]
MSSGEKERDALETGVPESGAAEERDVKRGAGSSNGGEAATAAPTSQQQQQQPSGDGGPSEEEGRDHRSATIAHIQQNFGVMARVLEREVFRRGLINSSVEEMYSVFSMKSTALLEFLITETDQHALHAQILEMLLTILEPTYGIEHARMLVAIMDQSVADLYLFQALLSTSSLDTLVQRAEEFMDPPTRSVGSGMSGGIPGNYSGVPSENVRGVQPTYNNASAPVRSSYAEFGKDRRVEPAMEPNIPRGANTYTEGGGVPTPSQPEDEPMPAVTSGWANVQRKHVEHDREVPVHHYQQQQQQQHQQPQPQPQHLQHRVPFNPFLHQQRQQPPNVAHHHQVVVGTGPMGLQQQQQQQQLQQQQPENHQPDSFPRAPVVQGPQKRMMDRVSPGTQESEDAHLRGAMWRGPLPPPGAQHDAVTVPQPSYHPQNQSSPPTLHPNQHQLATPNSPTHSRFLLHHRHVTAHFAPPVSMGKQASPQPAMQLSPQLTPQPVTTKTAAAATATAAVSISNPQRVMVPHHHHHHHHHHDIPPPHLMMPRVSPPSQTTKSVAKPEPVNSSETTPVVHNAEAAVPQLKPHHFHHIPSIQKVVRQPPPNVSMSASVGVGGAGAAGGGFSGGGSEAPSHGIMIPTHHHMLHHFQQIRPVVQPQQQQYRQSPSSAPGPMSIDALSNEEMNWASSETATMLSGSQEIRCFFRERGVTEPVVNVIAKMFLSMEELMAIPREALDERLRKEGVSANNRQYVWAALHPSEKTTSEKDVPEMSELRNFIHSNSIHNNMSQEGDDENATAKGGRTGKTMLQVPQPRTSQGKPPQSGKVGEYYAVIWVSLVRAWQLQTVLGELSKYGKVLQHGTSSRRRDLVYFKLGEHKNELQMVRKIGGAVVEDYYRVSPGDVDDGAPPTPTGRSEEADDNGSSKIVGQKAGAGLQPYPQHPQQPSANRGEYGVADEEDMDGDEGRTHRKGSGVRHTRGRGRGGHHGYHHHRHSEGSHQTICKFFSKGTCKYGDRCQFFHPAKHASRS